MRGVDGVALVWEGGGRVGGDAALNVTEASNFLLPADLAY